MSLIALLFGVIVICFVVWAVRALTAAFGVGEPLSTILLVLVVLLVLVAIAQALGMVHTLRL